MISLGLALSLGLGLALPAYSFTKPTVGETWDYPLGYKLTAQNADGSTQFYSVDLVNTDASDIATLKANGHTIVCYFSAGSREDYRSDANQFPSEAIGNVLDGYPHENWVDTRNQKVRDIMVARITEAVNKGCEGVDADNIDGYANDTGFNLTEDDGVAFIQYLSDAAHGKGLAFGLKNGGDIADRVIDDVEWEINEQCVEFNECDTFKSYIDAGKPVFHVEYTNLTQSDDGFSEFLDKSCDADGQQGFSTIVKHVELDQFVVRCS